MRGSRCTQEQGRGSCQHVMHVDSGLFWNKPMLQNQEKKFGEMIYDRSTSQFPHTLQLYNKRWIRSGKMPNICRWKLMIIFRTGSRKGLVENEPVIFR